jgi:hypothetical protein
MEQKPSYLKDLKLTLQMIKVESQKQKKNIDGNLLRNLVNKAEFYSLFLEEKK